VIVMTKNENKYGFIEGSKLLFKLMRKPSFEDVADLVKLSVKVTSLFGLLALIIMIIAYYL